MGGHGWYPVEELRDEINNIKGGSLGEYDKGVIAGLELAIETIIGDIKYLAEVKRRSE